MNNIHLRKPMQGKRRVKEVNGPGREKPPVKGTRNSCRKVRAVVIGGEALLHAPSSVVGQRREELEESVEIVARKVGEKRRELRRVNSGGLVTLGNVLDDHINDVNGVASAGASQVHNHKGNIGRTQLNTV